MEKRNKITSIFKSNDPDKLLVFRSISLQNEIRFYLNPTQYFTAVECEKGCEIRLRDESDEKEEFNKKSELSIIRENLKETIKSVSITLGFLLLATIGLLYLNKIIDNLLVFLLIMNITFFITISVSVILMGSMLLTPALKSKHSAEHMMVNFLEINKRLPKNIAEVKKSSRFSPNCGCRQLIKIIVKVFILSIVSTIFAVIVSGIVSHFYSNSQTNVIVFLLFTFLGVFLLEK